MAAWTPENRSRSTDLRWTLRRHALIAFLSSDPNRAPTGSAVIRISIIIAGFLGFLLFVFLIAKSGVGDVGRVMLILGWSLAPITLFHVVPLSFSAFSWRALIPAACRPRVPTILWVRWIRESINSLLPVAGVGGDFVGARLVRQRGVPGPEAAAAMVVDTTVGVATQLVFVVTGVALLVVRTSGDGALEAAYAVLVGVAILAALIAAFVLAQHRSLFGTVVRLAHRLAPAQALMELAGGAEKADEAIVAMYRRGASLLRASVLRLIGWAVGAGEVWLVLHFLDRPFSLVDAFILESLSSGVRAAAFMVPGALGALEGGFVLFGQMFGLTPDVAVAISLSKRVRELALGLPGLVLVQWIEGRRLLARGEAAQA
jgi:putative membrane protein